MKEKFQQVAKEVEVLLETIVTDGEENLGWEETFGMFHIPESPASVTAEWESEGGLSSQLELGSLSSSLLPQ